jgi:chromosome partitioning protein
MARHPKYMLTTTELGKLVGQEVNDVRGSFDKKDLVKTPGGKTQIPPGMVQDYLAARGIDYTFKVVAHINMRGGVGKTTSTVSAATRAAQYGFKTCILDMDSQGSASLALDVIPGENDPIFCDVWQHPDEMVMGSLKLIEENLYILPSSLENGLLDISLVNPSSQKNAVRGVCEELKTNGFDLVVIDCPPSLGTAVISTICAADIIAIPVCHDPFSFKGLEITLGEIMSICETFRIEKPKVKVLYTKFDRRISMSLEALQQLSSAYGEYLIPVPIRTNTEFSKAFRQKETVFASTRKSTAKDDYDMYVRYLLGFE